MVFGSSLRASQRMPHSNTTVRPQRISSRRSVMCCEFRSSRARAAPSARGQSFRNGIRHSPSNSIRCRSTTKRSSVHRSSRRAHRPWRLASALRPLQDQGHQDAGSAVDVAHLLFRLIWVIQHAPFFLRPKKIGFLPGPILFAACEQASPMRGIKLCDLTPVYVGPLPDD